MILKKVIMKMNKDAIEEILLFCSGFIFGSRIILGYWFLASFIAVMLAYAYREELF